MNYIDSLENNYRKPRSDAGIGGSEAGTELTVGYAGYSHLATLIGTQAGARLAGLSAPFSQPIALYRTRIAGTTHIADIAELATGLLCGNRLTLRLEKHNRLDPNATVVLDSTGRKLGYLPCDENEIIANLLRAGKHLYAQVVDKQLLGTWHKIGIEVFLDD
jgi:hypothetical protein